MKYGNLLCLLLLNTWPYLSNSFIVSTSPVVQGNPVTRTSQPSAPFFQRYHKTTSAIKATPPLISAVASPLGSVGILAFVVLIHELGHYSLAKRLGIAVEEFSVGFGPKIIGFKARGDDFSLRAIPLGGYVRFPENYNTTLARDIERREFEAQGKFMESLNKSPGWKFSNVLTLGVLEDRVWESEKRRRKQEEESIGLEERKSILARVFRRQPVAPKLPVFGEIEYFDDPSLLQNRPWTDRAQVVSGGVLFNLILAFSLFFGQINFGPGVTIPKVSEGILVTARPQPNVAATGLLEKGDVIIGVNGVPLNLASPSPDQALLEARQAIDEFIATVRSTENGKSLSLSILHEGKPANVKVTPRKLEEGKSQSIGVLLAPNVVGTETLKTSNPLEAARLAAKFVSNLTKQTAQGLIIAFTSLITGSGAAQLSGPVGLIQEGSAAVSTQSWSVVFLFAATISINLAVLNSFPLPALDGGQLVFILAEAVTGRKVNQQLQERLTGTAVLLLLGLSLAIFAGDITSLLK